MKPSFLILLRLLLLTGLSGLLAVSCNKAETVTVAPTPTPTPTPVPTPVPTPSPANVTLQGIQFDDLNGNGVQDASEPGLAGATVYIDLNANSRLDSGEPTQTTDASGNYTFTSLFAGQITVRLVPANGRIQTFPTSGQSLPLPAGNLPNIVGGGPAAEGAWPWIVGLLNASVSNTFDAQFCGGALIAPSWVITAGHCILETDGTQVLPAIDILVGTNTLGDGSGTRIRVSQIFVNPNYNAANLTEGSDIALLKLETPYNSTETLSLVGSGELALANPGITSSIIGWGGTNAQISPGNPPQSFPTQLQQASLPIIDNATCNAPASYNGSIIDSQLCAGLAAGGVDTCQGDSGGPLVVPFGSGGFKLAGITSFGVGCAQPNLYGVYTRVSSFTTFVSDIVNNTSATSDSVPTGTYTLTASPDQTLSGVVFGSKALFSP